jgi:hypothetical protein
MHIRLADFFRILCPLAKLFALWLVAFQLCRLILVAATWPLRGDATAALSAYANHIAGNGAYLLFNALQNRKQKNPEIAFWRGGIPAEAGYKIVRDMTLHSKEALIQPETYPLLRRSTPSPIAKKRPKKHRVVMMESFSARFTGAIGAGYARCEAAHHRKA